MKYLVGLLVVLSFSLVESVSLDKKFAQFVREYERSYADDVEEYDFRKSVFANNLKSIEEVQARNPMASFGVNEFADLTDEEFASTYLSTIDVSKPKNVAYKTDFSGPRHPTLVADPDPTNYDWNSAGVITEVYQQGRCGDCWAFSATETIESYWALAGNNLTSLSVEQVIDCNARGNACGGGLPEIAYGYAMKVGGLESLESYPYTAMGGNSSACAFNASYIVASISGHSLLAGEDEMYSQLSSPSGGPVGVCVDASTWRGYTGGILTSCPDTISHCVQVTGYANYGGANPYWIVRNQWGTNWGINGYIYIAIGSDLCGIATHVSIVAI